MKRNRLGLIGLILLVLLLVSFVVLSNFNQSDGELLKISYVELKEKIDKNEDFILIVSRSNCSHCVSYKPKVEQVAKRYGIVVYYFDYDEETDEEAVGNFLESFNLDGSTPMTLFIKDGTETSILNRLEGDVEKDQIIERFEKMGFISS